MNKRRFQNQKQFTAGLRIFARQQNVFKISIQPLLVSHPKTFALRAENNLGIPAEDKPSPCLGEREIEMWRQAAIDRSELLSHKRGDVDLSLARGVFLSGRQFQTKSCGRLPVAVSLNLTKETILGPRSNIRQTNARS